MSLTTYLHLVPRLRSYTSTSRYIFMTWCLIKQEIHAFMAGPRVKHRDNFAAYIFRANSLHRHGNLKSNYCTAYDNRNDTALGNTMPAHLCYRSHSQSESEGDLDDTGGVFPGSDTAAAHQHKEECAQELGGQHAPDVAVVRDIVQPHQSLRTCVPIHN